MMILEMLVFRDWYNLSLGLDELAYPELQIKCWGTSTWVVWLLNESDTQMLASGIWGIFLAHKIS